MAAAAAILAALIAVVAAAYKMNRDILIWFLGILALLSIIGGAWYRYEKTPTTPASKYSDTNTPFVALMKTNADFLNAQNFMKAKNYPEAIASYQFALLSATDSIQKAQIEFKIAMATAAAGVPIAAIKIYKQLVADITNIPIMRAYAVQAIGMLYYAGLDDSITTEIFKEEPYKSFFVPGDTVLSYRQLFDYGSSFYPLAVPELYIADWYAMHITTLYKTSSTSPEVTAAMAIIEQKFKNADVDIKRTQSNTNENQLIPLALLRKAVTTGKLSYLGLTSSTDAESAYKTALATYDGFGLPAGSDGYVRYYYALFLFTTYGNKRAADVETLLKPLYTDPGHDQYATVAFFKNARMRNDQIKKNFQNLARLDPGLKTYLISLGWKTTDF